MQLIYKFFIYFLDNTEINKKDDKTEDTAAVCRRTKVSRIALNIPAAGLGSRPPSIVSTGTQDEGGFNEPYPEIKAKLKPHEDSLCTPSESSSSSSSQVCITENVTLECRSTDRIVENVEKKSAEPIYAVPHKLTSTSHQKSTTSTDSSASQVTVIPQKSVDSDIMYNTNNVITNSVLSELESQDSIEKNEEFLQMERSFGESISVLQAVSEKSEPFLMTLESLKSSDSNTITTEAKKAEANILDLNDVEFADASDNEQEISAYKKVVEADTMTPTEAENLLSTK